ncbi:hypothetical protein JST99_00490 [Candidatus Dependentiae bacterium]|nr:hypothetical protein [Candidatus Dependentiae bacterium]MCC7415143.1 hypothetical protein [Campylobacterota bacterium]
MKWLESIQTYVTSLDRQQLYRLMGGIAGAIALLIFLVLYLRHSYIEQGFTQLVDINEQREKIKIIATRAERVKKQRQEVDAMLAKDESFTISGYLEMVLKKLHLSDKTTIGEHSQVDLENGYRESTRKIILSGMNMKQLSELLRELEQNERIYTKELEITRSSRQPQTIDVMLSVATLEPRTTLPG